MRILAFTLLISFIFYSGDTLGQENEQIDDPDCPNCTPSERYSHELSTLIDYAEQIKTLDDALAPLSPETIAYLQRVVEELPLGDVSATTINLALQRWETAQEEIDRAYELELLNRQIELVQIQASLVNRNETAFTSIEDLPEDTEDDNYSSVPTESVTRDDSADIRRGVFVTFVRPAVHGGLEAVTLTIDSQPRSFTLGGVFEYQGDNFEIREIMPNDRRADGRSYNVYAVNTDTQERILLDWAN